MDDVVRSRPRTANGAPSEERTRTGDRLLDEAAKLFRERGYATATTRELARRLGIRKASLYHHIDTKEELLYALCMESLRRVAEATRHDVADAAPEERLSVAIATHLRVALRDRDMHATVLFELRQLTPEHMVLALEQRDAYESWLRDLIAEEQAAGRLRRDIEARYLTLTLLNVLNWTIFWFTPDREMTSDELAGIFSTVFIDGAGAGAGAGGNGTPPPLAATPKRPARRAGARRASASTSARRTRRA